MNIMSGEDRQPKRQFERISVDADVCYFDNSSRHTGRLLDCSADGMLIETEVTFPLQPKLHVVIFTGTELLSVPTSVVRVRKKEGCYQEIGLRVLHTSETYLQYVIKRALGDVSQ
jgi:hypothetical protein